MPHGLRVLRGVVVETGGTLLAKHGLAQTSQPLVDYCFILLHKPLYICISVCNIRGL